MKRTILIIAPVSSRSGYGERSRDIVRALLASTEASKYELYIIDINWGNTPQTGLDPVKDSNILSRCLPTPQLQFQPDICIHITVPNEFQRVGKYLNIGMTAGIETTICSREWIEGCNRMDLIITSSEHSKNVFKHTVYKLRNTQTGQETELKVHAPVEVLFEGIRTDVFKRIESISNLDNKVVNMLSSQEIPENFCFLFTGHWLPGELGHDRKDVGMLVKTFLETFKQKMNPPALILKTGSVFSEMERELILSRLRSIYNMVSHSRELPNTYVIFGELTESEMNSLYNHPKIKAHISFTKGEGYGRPLAEASISAKPLIVSNWSGLIDFTEFAVKLPGHLTKLHPSAVWDKVLVPESAWFTVNYGYASTVLKDVFENYKNYEINAKKQATLVRKQFDFDSMVLKFTEILKSYIGNKVPVLAPLQLPTLTSLQLPTLISADKKSDEK